MRIIYFTECCFKKPYTFSVRYEVVTSTIFQLLWPPQLSPLLQNSLLRLFSKVLPASYTRDLVCWWRTTITLLECHLLNEIDNFDTWNINIALWSFKVTDMQICSHVRNPSSGRFTTGFPSNIFMRFLFPLSEALF